MAIRLFRTHLINLLALCSLCAVPQIAQADKEGDACRALMTTVKRVAVVPPFFTAEILRKPEAAESAARAKTSKDNKENKENIQFYLAQLRKLEARTKERLPERVAARTPFEVITYEELESAMEDLDLTPEQLFQNNGVMKGNRFPMLNPEVIKKLCSTLEVDAIVLGILDEPRRSNGRTIFDPCGIYYESPHVRSRAGYFIVMADGTEALKPVLDVLRPLTRIGKREYLLVDWLEAQDVIVENLMDEWTRYTPAKPALAEKTAKTASEAR